MVAENKKTWIVLVGSTIGSIMMTYAITKQIDPVPTAKTYISGAGIGSFVGGLVTLAILSFFD